MPISPQRSPSNHNPVKRKYKRKYLPFSATRRLLWSIDHPCRCELVGGSQADAVFFSGVLEVRKQTDDRWPDQETPVDTYSDQYCMYVNSVPVGVVGVTRALHGKIFFHNYYPPQLLDVFHDRLISGYRFRFLTSYSRTSPLAGGMSLSLTLFRKVWHEHIIKGVGIDIINVEQKYIRYYQRLGYVLCEGFDFLCPIFHVPISIMFLPTDPTRKSIIQDFIQERDDHITLDEVLGCLTRTQVSLFQRAAV